jgi:hypothetical protein
VTQERVQWRVESGESGEQLTLRLPYELYSMELVNKDFKNI